MYKAEVLEETEEGTVIRLIPLKERKYTDENGYLVIEYYDD